MGSIAYQPYIITSKLRYPETIQNKGGYPEEYKDRKTETKTHKINDNVPSIVYILKGWNEAPP